MQIKAQVKLFIASNVIDVQEHQLLNMLDTVPDKVLVCSKESNDDIQAKPVYNNRQMRSFFGQSFVKEENKSPVLHPLVIGGAADSQDECK